MSKKLVLAEKPSVAKDIAKALGVFGGKEGYIEGNEYIVTWALGHLVTLADPEEYKPEDKEWRMDYLPMIPDRMKLTVIGNSAKQYRTVKFLLDRKDVSEIIIATDAGREGELVARWILQKAGVRKPMKRLWISSVTEKAIKEGFRKLRDSREYDNLYRSAEARSHADWIVGINGTRALTVKHNAQLSLGRVQTPTLAIVQAREEENRSFKPQEFHTVRLKAGSFQFSHDGGRIFVRSRAEELVKGLEGKDLVVTEVTKSDKKRYAPELYDLTELQRDGNRLYGYSPKETLGIMQMLYERHKVLTYPRTDSRYLTTDMVGTLAERVKACGIGEFSLHAREILKKGIVGRPSFINDKKVSDHHAIIPTEESVILNTLTDKERKIYLLVVKRFLCALMDPYEYRELALKGTVGEERFSLKLTVTLKQGFRLLSKDQEEDVVEGVDLPEIHKGDRLKVTDISLKRGMTEAPGPFNEGTLLTAMENPGKYMASDDKTLQAVLAESSGLGTVATRADIIEKLFSSFVLEKRGKDIFITQKGRQLLTLAPVELKSPELTARWEHKLGKISRGELSQEVFIREMEEYTRKMVKEIKETKETFRHDNVTGSRCPECSKFLLEVKGKGSTMLVCQDRECGYRKTLSVLSNARCPDCHKKMELVGEGEAKAFKCVCGYREKLTAFNIRREKEGTSMAKKDVSRYLSDLNRKNDEPVNSALADALKDMFK
ncbi:MAG TPA: DNA topoisomerase III [Clostridiaceae bacterium]|nr:DNA topoisomerase III [Clostridiaceae bacterium]